MTSNNDIKIGGRYVPTDASECGALGGYFERGAAAYLVVTSMDDGLHFKAFTKGGEALGTCFNCYDYTNLVPYGTTLETVEEGDYIDDEDGAKCMVYGRVGRMVALSDNDEFDEFDGWYDVHKLKENGWKVVSEDSDAVELTVGQIEEKLGHKIKVIKEAK